MKKIGGRGGAKVREENKELTFAFSNMQGINKCSHYHVLIISSTLKNKNLVVVEQVYEEIMFLDMRLHRKTF